MSVEYIRPKSRTERPIKTKIGIEVAHVTRDSDSTFKVKRSKVKVTKAALLTRRREALRRQQREERGGAYCGGRPPTA